jgi:hypothetical protein
MAGGKRKGSPKTGGRQRGTPNKITGLLKDAILKAAEKAGGEGGIEAFLEAQARKENNAPFMALLGKVLPTQLAAEEDALVPQIVLFRSVYETTREEDAAGIPPTPYIPRDYSKRD